MRMCSSGSSQRRNPLHAGLELAIAKHNKNGESQSTRRFTVSSPQCRPVMPSFSLLTTCQFFQPGAKALLQLFGLFDNQEMIGFQFNIGRLLT